MCDPSTTIHQPDFIASRRSSLGTERITRFSAALHPILSFQDLNQWNNNGTRVWMESFLPIFRKQIHRHWHKEIRDGDQKDPSQARKRRLTCSFQIMIMQVEQ